ncbi:MAG: alpha/beta hydrolase, partial [Planctomycetaceae bacterium]
MSALLLAFLCCVPVEAFQDKPSVSVKPPQPTPTRAIVYKNVDGVELKLQVFEPQGHKPTDKRGAIVFFFCGGWVNGTPKQFYPHCDHLAKQGIV